MTDFDKLICLWEAIRNDDVQAFSSLHSSLYPGLLAYAVRMTKDEDMASDILQDLFIKFWQNRARIGSITSVKAYFYKSARCMILNQLRSCALRASKIQELEEPEMEHSTEQVIFSAEFDRALRKHMVGAINKLPAKQKEIINMRFYENLEYTQIAERTGIQYQSVINHVYRAVCCLKKDVSINTIYAA